VGSSQPHKLLGVRDAFLRYFRDGLNRPVSIALVPHGEVEIADAMPLSDEEAIETARGEAGALDEKLGETYHFYVANEGGLHSLEVDGQVHHFVRSWTVLRCVLGEAWGASGSVQIPGRLVSGLDDTELALAVPGTRRSGGMIASLTGGMESRRSAVSTATLHALSTLFYGLIESRPGQRH